jgi:dTDP-glucose 4,6-dehydratase
VDLVKKILDIQGKNYSLIEYVADRKGHDFRYALDSNKMLKEFGWKANIKINEGLVKMKNLCS